MARLRLTTGGSGAGLRHVHGFSLIELAMVLFIISLVIGGLLVPLATQLEARQRSEAQAKLEEIQATLIGYAMINGELPCPTTQADPTHAKYGVKDDSCAAPVAEGYLPWKTLGMANGLDPWGTPRTSTADPWTGHWRYRVNTAFATPFSMSDTQATNNLLCVLDSTGNLAVDAGETPVAVVYSTGANITADGENTTYESTGSDTTCTDDVTRVDYESGTVTTDFDDLLIWVSRPLLISRMVNAGTLP